MKAIYNTIQKKIQHLCVHMENSILVSLLLLRHLSHNDSLPPFLTNDDAKQIGPHLWEIVLTNQEGNYMSSITKSLTLAEPLFPFVHILIEHNKRQAVEESVLEQLIHLLSDISTDDMLYAVIYKNHLRKKHAHHMTPASIAQCLAKFLSPVRGTAYDPCCGSGALLLAVQRHSAQNLGAYGQAQDESSYLLSQINLILHGIYADLGETAVSALLNDQHKNKKFNYIIANPPFNSADWLDGNSPLYDERWQYGVPPRSNANFAWLQHILSHLESNGRAAVILPNGTLTTQTHREAFIRRSIVQDKWIEAVITLPPGLFYSTKVPCCIWLLTNNEDRSGDILFVDAARMEPEIKRNVTSAHMKQLTELVTKHRQGILHSCTDWYGVASIKKIEQKDFITKSKSIYCLFPA